MLIQTDDHDLPSVAVFEPNDRDEKRAEQNHGQTLRRLNERLGVSWCELAAIVSDRDWREMDEASAIREIELEFYRRGEPARRAARVLEFAHAHRMG